MQPKVERILALMEERGLDGILVSSPENFHYLAGFAGHQHTVSRSPAMAFALLSRTGLWLVTMDFELETFRKRAEENGLICSLRKYDTWVGVKDWGELSGDEPCFDLKERRSSLGLLGDCLRESGLERGRLGVETAFLPMDYSASLRELAPQAELADASELFVTARSVKTAEEVELFRRLCRVVSSALAETEKMVMPGTKELELANCYREQVIRSGFCYPSYWSMFAAGESGARLCLPGERAIAQDDVLKFDGGVTAGFDFYTTDTSRSWVMPGADPLLHRLKERLSGAQARMIDAIRPGLPICELYKAGYNYVAEAFPAYRRGHMGHSISLGPATAEAPYITAEEKRLLEPGMILAVEAPCYIRGVAGFNIEDMVLVTERGAEVLTGY